MPGHSPIRRKVTVANPNGLHMRPASAFAQLANTFCSNITVKNGSTLANGKSAIDIMLLVALPGAELELIVEGEDAGFAIESLAEQLGSMGEPE
jgi:phosphotransferase system HPr (HPr) family protein